MRTAGDPGNGMKHYAALAARAIRNTIRQPAAIIPSLLFPLMFQTMTASAMGNSTRLPGFPAVDSFVQFSFATTIIQGAIFGSTAAGSALAADIEGGFFERLLSSPVRRTAIIVGQVSGAALLGFFMTWFFYGATALFGLEAESGLQGVLAVSLVITLLAAGMGGLMCSFALWTGSREAVEGSFPMFFVLIFMSSAFFPRNLMEGWFKSVTSINPISHLIEGVRAQIIGPFDGAAIGRSIAVAAAVFILGVGLSLLALRRRLAG